MRATDRTHRTFLDLITLIISGEVYKLRNLFTGPLYLIIPYGLGTALGYGLDDREFECR